MRGVSRVDEAGRLLATGETESGCPWGGEPEALITKKNGGIMLLMYYREEHDTYTTASVLAFPTCREVGDQVPGG